MAIELTEAALAALQPPATGRVELKDTRVSELSLRVTATDQRTWSVRARLPDGKQIRPTIGHFPELGIAAARRKAKQVLGDIERGIDPTAEKRAAAQAKAETATAPRVADRLAEWQTAKAKDWSERYRIEISRAVDKVINPKLGKCILAETTRDDWTGLATATARSRKPLVGASWLYDVVSSFLNYCDARGWVAANPLPRRGRNHLAPRPQARNRVLGDDELVRVWQASAMLSPKSRGFVRLLILTAARQGEVADIAVGEVNLLKRQWVIPGARTKNRQPLTVPLSALAIAALQAVWPEGAAAAGYRLLGAIKGSGLKAPSKIKVRLDRLSGVEDWRLHDLRRTARTGMARLGVSDRAAEAALNHISDRSALIRVYDRYDYAREAWSALETWQAYLDQILREAHDGSLALDCA